MIWSIVSVIKEKIVPTAVCCATNRLLLSDRWAVTVLESQFHCRYWCCRVLSELSPSPYKSTNEGLVTFINRFMPGLTSAFRIGWGLSSWLLYVHVKFELLMVLRWYCVNTLESYNFIDVYIIWATLEALFLPFRIQFTTKRCQNALMYKKIFISILKSNDP